MPKRLSQLSPNQTNEFINATIEKLRMGILQNQETKF